MLIIIYRYIIIRNFTTATTCELQRLLYMLRDLHVSSTKLPVL